MSVTFYHDNVEFVLLGYKMIHSQSIEDRNHTEWQTAKISSIYDEYLCDLQESAVTRILTVGMDAVTAYEVMQR